jgi:hypothetical protein
MQHALLMSGFESINDAEYDIHRITHRHACRMKAYTGNQFRPHSSLSAVRAPLSSATPARNCETRLQCMV